MSKNIIEVYEKEREYQQKCFGDYSDLEHLNFASFLLFIEKYLKKAKEEYNGLWDKELPDWMNNCDEFDRGSAPVKAYEELIKVMALAGAALETYTDLDPEHWRKDPEEGSKWKKIKTKET